MAQEKGVDIHHKPLCFIIMPFGKKQDAKGNVIDFDYVYNNLIRKVIEQCGLNPIRADHEMIGGIIHKPMYERLILCDYAIADLTTANANVFYELGIRYTAKPFTTFSIFETETKIPFDLVDVRCFPYSYADGTIVDIEDKIAAMVNYINGVKANKGVDSPVYQLLDGIQFTHNLSDDKVELLREQTAFNESLDAEIREVIQSDKNKQDKAAAISEIEKKLGDRNDWTVSIVIDLLLAYRSISCFENMVQFIESLPLFIRKTVGIQEQYGFALNRAGRRDDAVKVLQKLIDENGANSETCGILGRVYKDKYTELKTTKPLAAAGFLDKAINTYLDGYKADMRDFFPGVNAATLLCIKKDPYAADVAKAVELSVQAHLEKKSKRQLRTISSGFDNYWPYATLVELAVIQGNPDKASKYLGDCLAISSEPWQRETTANNLKLLAGDNQWALEVAETLLTA